jgi:hypothetical protein
MCQNPSYSRLQIPYRSSQALTPSTQRYAATGSEVLPVLDHDLSIHQYIPKTSSVLVWVFEGGQVFYFLFVEYDYVGAIAFAQ